MRITTWNINSVRLRLAQVLRYLEEQQPDVLCLQEIKCPTDKFPHGPLAELGYVHQHVYGMKGYNGVAILARQPFAATGVRDWCDRADARHAWARFADGLEVHNLYIPAGGDAPDPVVNEKFAHKLDFLARLADWCRAAPARRNVWVGDFNVAPLPTDVWSHKQLLKVVSHTPEEVALLDALKAAGGFVDAVRAVIPEEEKLFTWWSYRARDWRASNRGRRLDHIWLSPDLAAAPQRAEVYDRARDWDKPSDHAPLSVDLDL